MQPYCQARSTKKGKFLPPGISTSTPQRVRQALRRGLVGQFFLFHHDAATLRSQARAARVVGPGRDHHEASVWAGLYCNLCVFHPVSDERNVEVLARLDLPAANLDRLLRFFLATGIGGIAEDEREESKDN